MRVLIISIAFLMYSVSLTAKVNTDSLITVLANAKSDSSRIALKIEIGASINKATPIDAIQYLKEAITELDSSQSLSDRVSNELRMSALANLATSLSHVGEKAQATELLLEVLALSEELKDLGRQRSTLANLGVEFQNQGMYEEALRYYRRAMKLSEMTGSVYGEAMGLGNIGTCIGAVYPDSTLYYYKSSLRIMRNPEMHDQAGAMGWMMNNIGSWYENEGVLDSALHYYLESARIRESIDHRLGKCLIYRDLGQLYWKMDENELALKFIDKSIEVGEDNELVAFIYNSYLFRSELRYQMGDFKGSIEDHRSYLEMRDSVRNERDAKSLIRQTMTYEYDKKHLADSLIYVADKQLQEKETQRQKEMKNGFMGGFVIVALFAVVFFFQRNRISKEKARSEELLLNILPEEVAEELKEKGEAEAQLIDQVTVLFTDFKGFTAMSEVLRPRELVKDLNACFSEFDEITAKYGIEKIKTIGDAYMAAGGLPTPNKTHATDVINAALEMRDFVDSGKAEKIRQNLPYFEIRIGVHTGPVVAGIVGVKKFQYDIWGDTVNTASRMESSGEVGKVNVSQSTYELVKDDPSYEFESRGKVEAKGKGEMEMYFVKSKIQE